MKSDADAFLKRASQCRDVANGTEDLEAQRELRELATELDSEADGMEEDDTRREPHGRDGQVKSRS